jgi:hypothetical protein
MYKMKWIALLTLLLFSCYSRRELTENDQQDSGSRDSGHARTRTAGGAGTSVLVSGGSEGIAGISVAGASGGIAGVGGAVGGMSGTVIFIDAGGIDAGGAGGTSGACASIETYCSNFSRCIDLRSNPMACGSCYNGCPYNVACVNGSCDPKTCLNGLTPCTTPDGYSSCLDLASDQYNCGSCNHACNFADSCENGKCQQPECDTLDYCPDTGCVDTSTDVSNCGSCGHVCEKGNFYYSIGAYGCDNGECGCSPLANTCGDACAIQFWYCPPKDFTGDAAAYCTQSARNSYERCACQECLQQVQDCFGSASCVEEMDCSLGNHCVGCAPLISSCSDSYAGEDGDPLEADLIDCINDKCG